MYSLNSKRAAGFSSARISVKTWPYISRRALYKRSYKQSKVLGNTMGVAEEILVLVRYSPKRENILGCIKEQVEFESQPEEKANDITKLSQTQGTVLTTCLQRIIDKYETLV